MDNCISNSISDSTAKGKRALCALLCSLSIALAPGLSLAGGDSLGAAKEGGIGMAAALTSLVYGPVKIVYATGGAVIAGFAWVFSGGDSDVASTILTRSVRGTYVITPGTIAGEEEIEFVGRSPEYRPANAGTQVASAPDGW